ncbi:ferritin-like domain-containing protein [Alcaligenes sp. WGS1538]|uniref:ferritin-like domain-containing protein n=1 Tax=Alcaligenes sp. WGS1538 TaxID=3366811 RepID=UPI00372D2F7A
MDRNDSRANEHLMDWLRDAHAMEEQSETMLSSMLSRIESYPELRMRIQRHIDETREQQRLVRTCIERRGGDTSLLKDLTGKVMAAFQGFSGVFASDEVVKGAMFSFAFENLEIAAYTQLKDAADFLGDMETAAVCQRILGEERAMAQWLEEHSPALVQSFLARSEDPDTQAKR